MDRHGFAGVVALVGLLPIFPRFKTPDDSWRLKNEKVKPVFRRLLGY